MKFIFLMMSVLILVTGCQQKPTKIVNQEPVMGENVTAENLIKDNPVILDTRPPFEFNLAHVPGAINVRWEDSLSKIRVPVACCRRIFLV